MSKYSIPTDAYAKIVNEEIDDKKTIDFLMNIVSIWDEIIANIYSGNDENVHKLYTDLKLRRDKHPELSEIIRLRKNITLYGEKQKYYTDKENYIFLASADDAYCGKGGIHYLQLLRQIKAQLYDGIHIPSALFDKLKYWDPAKKKNKVSSKQKQIQDTWNDAQGWAEPNKERLKPQPWNGLGKGAGVDGQVFLRFVEKNCCILGGVIRGNQWFSDNAYENNSTTYSSKYIQDSLHGIEESTFLNDERSENKEKYSTPDINALDSNILASTNKDAQDSLPCSSTPHVIDDKELGRISEEIRTRQAIAEKFVHPRQAPIQNALIKQLHNFFSPQGGNVTWEDERVDIKLVAPDSSITFIEIKPAPTTREAIRLAIGQLLEYCHYPDTSKADRLVIVSDADPHIKDMEYLGHLKNLYNISFRYVYWPPGAKELPSERLIDFI